MRPSIVSSAFVAALVGFGSTIAIVIAAAQALGATAAQTTSWVAAICLSMAATTGYLSVRYRMPIVTAWSTPGAALIAASSGISIEAAVGAFLLVGALIVLAAAVKPFGRLIERIPTAIAAAMLAGVLIRFVMAVFESAQGAPGIVLPLVAVFLVARLFNPALAVLAVLFVGLGLAFGRGLAAPFSSEVSFSALTLIPPAFDPAVLLGIGRAAVSRHDGIPEPARLRGSARVGLHPAGARDPGRHRSRVDAQRVVRRPYEQPRGDLGGDLHRPRHAS